MKPKPAQFASFRIAPNRFDWTCVVKQRQVKFLQPLKQDGSTQKGYPSHKNKSIPLKPTGSCLSGCCSSASASALGILGRKTNCGMNPPKETGNRRCMVMQTKPFGDTKVGLPSTSLSQWDFLGRVRILVCSGIVTWKCTASLAALRFLVKEFKGTPPRVLCEGIPWASLKGSEREATFLGCSGVPPFGGKPCFATRQWFKPRAVV